MVIGILGGIGAGKSTVTRLLVERGAEAVDADRMAHEVLHSERLRPDLERLWGAQVFGADGAVDHQWLAARVFRNPEERQQLEGLIHPEVRDRIESRVASFRAQRDHGTRLLVLDIPLLASSPLRALCDELLFVEAPSSVRVERTRPRGWSDDELTRREGSQVSTDEKRRMATAHVDNSGSLDETTRQIDELVRRWTGRATEKSS